MSESKHIHWAENDELLEQFVLGRLESRKVATLEKHVQECDQCRAAVEKERAFVDGIRLAGRESMKQRLSERLEQRTTQSVNWYRIAGVAAGIVLLVTVGIYNNRWFVGTESQSTKRDRADKTEKPAEPAPAVSSEEGVIIAEKPPIDAAKRAVDAEGQKVQDMAAGVAKSAEAPKTGGTESGNLAATQQDKRKDLETSEISRRIEGREKKDRLATATMAKGGAASWMEGTVILDRDQNRPAIQELAANARDERIVIRKEKAEDQIAGKAAKVTADENLGENFIIAQKLLSDLPPARQALQQKAFSVQALLEKNPMGTRITVFLDSLLTKAELSQTRIQAIREDSIILNLGNRIVGYKLPPDWTGQSMQQTKK